MMCAVFFAQEKEQKMKKLTMKQQSKLTFKEGCENYLQDCNARNLREGTIKHYKESIKSIYRFINPNTPIATLNQQTMNSFIIDMKKNLDVKDITFYTYARDLKTIMRFFMKNNYMKTFDIKLIKADSQFIICYHG